MLCATWKLFSSTVRVSLHRSFPPQPGTKMFLKCPLLPFLNVHWKITIKMVLLMFILSLPVRKYKNVINAVLKSLTRIHTRIVSVSCGCASEDIAYAFWLSKQLPGQLSAYSCWASSRFPVGLEPARTDSCPLPPCAPRHNNPPSGSHNCALLFNSWTPGRGTHKHYRQSVIFSSIRLQINVFPLAGTKRSDFNSSHSLFDYVLTQTSSVTGGDFSESLEISVCTCSGAVWGFCRGQPAMTAHVSISTQ